MIKAFRNFIRSNLRNSMQITLKHLSSPRKDGHILLLFKNEDFSSTYFTKDEIAFIKSELKAEKKFVAVNQYNRMVYLQQIETEKKNSSQRLEMARKSGATQFTRLQAGKMEQITLISTLPADLVLAYAEGLVLAGYQFLKYRTGKKKEEHTVKTVFIQSKGLTEKEIQQQNILNEAVFKARDLVNEPQSFLNATEFSRAIYIDGKTSWIQSSGVEQS
jgi:leucyl aminopeptidase